MNVSLDPLEINVSHSAIYVNETVFSNYPPALLDFAAACCIVFAIIGVIGNFVSILALTSYPKLRNATTAFIVNLCVADLLFCAFSLPLSAVTFLEREWNYGDTLCKLFPLLRYSNGAVSLFSIIAITINRYILVVHPKQYASIYTTSKIVIMIAVLWIASFALFFLPLCEVWGRFGYDPKVGTCSILPLNNKSPKMYLYSIAFGLPSIVFILCYSRIYYVVWKSSRNCQTNEPSYKERDSSAISFRSSFWRLRTAYRSTAYDIGDVNSHNPKRKKKKELRVLRVMIVIFITFILCYFPVSFVKIFKKEDDLHYFNIIGYLAVYFSNCINPVIYVAMSKEYRRAYNQLFCCSSRKKGNNRKRPPGIFDIPTHSFRYVDTSVNFYRT